MSHSFPRNSVHITQRCKRHKASHAGSLTPHMTSYRCYVESKCGRVDRVLLKHLLAMKRKQQPITMVTCYDASQALLADLAKVDSVLVGDSCANVIMGLKNTNKMTLSAMVHHTRAVTSGIERAYVVSDMPFGTYLTSDDAVRNAATLVGEGGASCVKLEGFVPDAIRQIARFVPVCAHLGLMPQTADCFGTRGRTYSDVKRLSEEALRIQEAGASFLVLEKVCAETAAYISQLLEIPTIGIGSGKHCDGQVLVWHDMLGLGDPEQAVYKFVKQFCQLAPQIVQSIVEYVGEVKSGAFPAPQHSYYLSESTRQQLQDDAQLWQPLTGVDSHEFFEHIMRGDQAHGAAAASTTTRIVKSAAEIRQLRDRLDSSCSSGDNRKQVIFVPFLGGLHDGHLALIEEAKKYGDTHQIWCSLFLNPLQFNDIADYVHYPYDMDADIAALCKLGVDVIFTPSVHDVYPCFDAQQHSFSAFVDFEHITSECDEGKSRPGHFKGVGTVLTKLFAWIRPAYSIFGQKDFMQCVLVKNLCREFFPDLNIIVHPTVRECDGLAMSSRNNKLSQSERERAPLIYQCLCAMEAYLLSDSQDVSIDRLKEIGAAFAQRHHIDLEYVSLHAMDSGRNLENLILESDAAALMQYAKSHEIAISIAASVGPSTRLIDNIVVGGDHVKVAAVNAII